MVLKYLFTRNQLLVGYILTSIVSFTSNIKLVSGAFSIIFYFPKFYIEVSYVKDILRKNAFLIKMVGNRIRTFLNKIFFAYCLRIDCRKKELFIILPHFGNLSLVIKTGLQNSINKSVPLSHIKFKIIFDDQYGTFAK